MTLLHSRRDVKWYICWHRSLFFLHFLCTDDWTKDRWKDPKQCVPNFCENNPFRSVFREPAPFFTALLILTTLDNEWFFHYDLKNWPFSTKFVFFATFNGRKILNDDSTVHCPALKRVPFIIVFFFCFFFFFFFCFFVVVFFSSIGGKLGSKHPPSWAHPTYNNGVGYTSWTGPKYVCQDCSTKTVIMNILCDAEQTCFIRSA